VPNSSIERMSFGKLHLLPATAHVERQASQSAPVGKCNTAQSIERVSLVHYQ
jgi:hypothetical protein